MNLNRAAAVLLASALVAGVAVAGVVDAGRDSLATTAPSPSLRLIVKLAHPPPALAPGKGAEIARQASEVAGVSVVFGAALSADRLALHMACAPAACEAAVQRLRDAPGLFVTVERDERRRRHSPP